MNLPNLNAVRMFDAAGRHLNFRRAADELHLTQGAVAQAVRRLEADLGRALFTRRPRGLAFTDAGRSYHAQVREALARLEAATLEVGRSDARVTVSVTPSLASKWLVPRLAAFSAAHPGIEIRTLADASLAEFRGGEVDIAVRQGEPPFGDGVDATLLAPLELCAFASPSLAADIGAECSLAKLASFPLLHDGHDLWPSVLRTTGLEGSRFNQTALALDAAANSQGVALSPRLLALGDVNAGRLAEVWRDDSPADRAGFYVLSPGAIGADTPPTAVVSWLLAQAPTR